MQTQGPAKDPLGFALATGFNKYSKENTTYMDEEDVSNMSTHMGFPLEETSFVDFHELFLQFVAPAPGDAPTRGLEARPIICVFMCPMGCTVCRHTLHVDQQLLTVYRATYGLPRVQAKMPAQH